MQKISKNLISNYILNLTTKSFISPIYVINYFIIKIQLKQQMLKSSIQELLSTQKVSSISDIICFIIQQVNKTLSQQPLQQLSYRLSQLQRSKGLDVIMIQQVKTIAEALIDQRQQHIRFDFQKILNQQTQNLEHLISNFNHYTKKTTRPSLAQIDIQNLLNTNSFSNFYQDQTRKTRQSYKQNFSHELIKDNLLSDCNKLKQKVTSDKKQVNDLKYSILQISRDLSNKITLEQAHKIISQFESRMFHKIQNQKLDLQKLQFQIKKQLQQQILKVRKEASIEYDIQMLRKQISTIRKISQKLQKKVQKCKQETKSISKAIKNMPNFSQQFNKFTQINLNSQQMFKKQIKNQKQKFQQYCQFNNSKNEDLNVILEQINQKLAYFQKVDLLDQKVSQIKENNLKFDEKISQLVCNSSKGQWLTYCKTKNQNITWEKQIYNLNPNMFKFQAHKSQILICQPSIYLYEFDLLEIKTTHLGGVIYIQSLNYQSAIKQIKVSGGTSLKSILQIDQKSLISLKLIGSQTIDTLGAKGLLKISKY